MKSMFTLVLAAIFLGLNSGCNKEYTCICYIIDPEAPDMGISQTEVRDVEYKTISVKQKDDAVEECHKFEDDPITLQPYETDFYRACYVDKE